MKVAAVGSVVRAYRKASGVSQKDLATMVGISRATLNYLESGRDLEIGAAKLLALLDLLGIPFHMPEGVEREHDDAVLDRGAKAAGGKPKLTRKVVVEALATGRVPTGFDKPLQAFLDGTSETDVLAVVRAVAAGTGQPPKAIWRNGGTLAAALGSSRAIWKHGD